MSNPEQNVNDPLDRATQALRDVKAPAGPPADLVSATLATLAEHDKQLSRRNKMKLIAKYSAAAIVLIAIGIVAVFTQSTQAAFSAVVEKVQQAHSVKFDITSSFIQPATNKPFTAHGTLTIFGDRMRTEFPGGMISILDFKSGQALNLQTAQKQAMLLKSTKPSPMKENLLEKFRNMSRTAGKSIGRKQIDGRELDGYQLDDNGRKTTLWADPTTHLPVRMEASLNIPMAPKADVVMDHFEWDVPVNESDFSMEVPPGYTTQEFSVKAAKPTEAELIDSLRLAAELNHGNFPDSFDFAGVQKILKPENAASQKAPSDALMSKAMTLMRGLIFVQKENGSDFHYAGKGVSISDKDHPIFWYQPANSPTYRVIDADFSAHEVSKQNLPTVESQTLAASSQFQNQVTTGAVGQSFAEVRPTSQKSSTAP